VTAWSDAARTYFDEHAIDAAFAADLGVREDAGAIVFPTVDASGEPAPRRRLLAIDGPKLLGQKGSSLALWWLAGRAGDRVLVCEGESDALAVESIRNAAAVGDGAAAYVRSAIDAVCAAPGVGYSADKLAKALRAARTREAVLAFDGDESGRRYTKKVAEALAAVDIVCVVVPIPDGEDLASLLAASNDRVGLLVDLLVESERGEEIDQAKRLPWRWAGELVAEAPDEPLWVFEGYVAAGAKTLLAGLPKGGKTTLIAALIEAVASSAQSFLGRRVGGGAVVLASEEGDSTLGPKLRGLPDGRVRVLNRDAAWPKPPWVDMIGDAVREAKTIGAILLVIDSMAFWAALEPEREKDSGAAQAIMDALDEATRAGLAVLLVHHQRKAPGEYGTGVRGSTALAGAVDVVIEYERLGEGVPRSQRRLVVLSRWPATPDVLVLDYHVGDGIWRVVGEAEGRVESEGIGLREKLLAVVPIESPGATENELATLVGLDKRKISRPLRELVGSKIERVGKGRKGAPYRYHRNAAPDSASPEGGIADSDSALPRKEGGTNPPSASDAALVGRRVPGEVEAATGGEVVPLGAGEAADDRPPYRQDAWDGGLE
jgi:hypothetical protein